MRAVRDDCFRHEKTATYGVAVAGTVVDGRSGTGGARLCGTTFTAGPAASAAHGDQD
jgi:hypothetical protein